MTIEKKLLGTTPAASGDTPEAVSFDGSNDYLSRSSDLSGNALTREMTLSFWWYSGGASSGYIFRLNGGYIRAEINTDGSLTFVGYASGAVDRLDMNSGAGSIPLNTWVHVLFSFDLTSTANRHLYINDVSVSPTYNQYINGDFNMLGSNIKGPEGKGRYAHVFLDYTYRDLSTESNRRLFIDSDGKPADGQADLNPLIYLPMTDAATAGSNSGTGGDFTVNGVLDTAGRAPNQFNCSASKFDSPSWSSGNDYLSKSSISGLTDGKKFTLSFVTRKDSNGNRQLLHFGNSNTIKFAIFHGYGSNTIYIRVYDTSSNIALNITGLPMIDGKIVHYTISVDMADTSKRFVYMNGESYAATYSTYTVNATLDFTWNQYQIGSGDDGSTQYWWDGSIGEFYFDTVYTDLATDNPFWDSDTNLPKPVRQVIEETGTTPLIALPLRGDDAGNNLGTGGDFTVNSGPYTGARGGSEFWARSYTRADGLTEPNANIGYLKKTNGLDGASANKYGTWVCAFKFNTLPSASSDRQRLMRIGSSFDSSEHLSIQYSKYYNKFMLLTYDQSQSRPGIEMSTSNTASLTTDTWYIVLGSWNTSSASASHWYCNKYGGSAMYDVIGSPYTSGDNTLWNDNSAKVVIGARRIDIYPSALPDTDLGFLYFNNSYIDFSQESNRNLFVDQLGYPKDLTPAIEAGDIADPLIYMKFDDTSALGTNSGTGSNFTVNGTVTAGADVDPNA